jgi:hypothetical protein
MSRKKAKPKRMGRPLKISSGRELRAGAELYFATVAELNKNNPVNYKPLTVEGLCSFLDLDARAFYRYIERDDDLGNAAWMVLQRITQNRIEDGLTERQNPMLVKFLLTNNAKFFYKEKQEVEHTVDSETRTLLQQLEGKVNKI